MLEDPSSSRRDQTHIRSTVYLPRLSIHLFPVLRPPCSMSLINPLSDRLHLISTRTKPVQNPEWIQEKNSTRPNDERMADLFQDEDLR